MADVFDAVRLKIMRAAHHSNLANEVIQKFSKSDFYRIEMEKDRKGRFVFRLYDVKPLPLPFGIFIGEAVHQLRSCLDHIMFALAKPIPGKEWQVEFPLVESRKKFRETRKNMPGVPRGVRVLVESLQPYHRRKWPDTALLGQLREIDNWDKHRMVIASVFSIEGVDLNIVNEFGAIVSHEKFRGIFKSGAIVASVTVSKAPQGAEVNMHPELQLIPIFDDRTPKRIRGIKPQDFIKSAGEFIRETIIPMFGKFV